MKDIVAGVVLIAIGLVFGGSVFRGDFDLPSIFFDGLGLFFIIRGLVRISRARRNATPDAPSKAPD
ncbi:MAG TPA: hypothetical protein VFM23_06025 [Gemmatimonadales bacterium]|nr:hypothetical protein [Gemmatimonadales bacterium]